MFFSSTGNDARLFIEATHSKLLGSTQQGTVIQALHNRRLSPSAPRSLREAECDKAKISTLKVLCFGHSRTGTLSLMAALQQLGYTPYHMTIAMDNPTCHLPLWIEAMQAKFEGKGRRWEKEEFEKMLEGFDALLDIPCCYFEELLEMYPDAKVIVTQRPVDEWLTSISSTVGHVLSWRSWPLIAWADPALTHPWYTFMSYTDTYLSFWTSACHLRTSARAREAYLAHYARIESLLLNSPKRALYLEAGAGWTDLCKFLGKDVPMTRDWEGDGKESYGAVIEWPRLNDKETYVAFHEAMWWRAMELAVRKLVWMVLVFVAVMMLIGWKA